MATVTSSVTPIHGTCTIGQPYGNPSSGYTCGFHTGIDFPKSQMDSYNIYSVCSGTVIKNVTGVTGRTPALGNECDVQRDGDGLVFRFCHMENGSNNHLSVGQHVDTSTYIGIVGNTGKSDGPHLHLECSTTASWNCNTFLNPGEQLGFGNTRGTVIVYDGGTPPPVPPVPPTPGPDTPTGPFYHRLFDEHWFWSTAPGYTGSLEDGSRKTENAKYIWKYLKNDNWELKPACVVIGAMDLVSTLNSAWKPTTDDDSAFGLLGWRYWEFTDWVDAQGEWVADSDYTIIDNSIGRICWFKQYNLGWDNEVYTLQAFSEDNNSLENLSQAWINYYVYNTLTYNALLERAKYWYKILAGGNHWKDLYRKKYTIID